MAKSQHQKFNELRERMSEVCTLIYKDGEKVGQVIGRWYHSSGTMNLQMGLKLWGTVPAGNGYTDYYTHVVKMTGCGYNKYREAMERLFRGAENWMEENLAVKFRVEKMLTHNPDNPEPWRDWFNHWEDILKEAGFTVIIAL